MTPSALLPKVFEGMETFFKKFPYQTQIKKEPEGALFCLVTAATAVRAFFVKGWVAGIEVLAVKLILSDSERITNLTKSKRCPKTLDT